MADAGVQRIAPLEDRRGKGVGMEVEADRAAGGAEGRRRWIMGLRWWWVVHRFWFDVPQKARPRGGEPFSSRHPESASPARDAGDAPGLRPSAPREFIRCPVSENGDFPHCSARAFGGSPSERVGFPVLSKDLHHTAPPAVDIIHTHIPSANRSARHGTCFRRRLSAHHAGAAPHSAVAELGVVRRLAALSAK